MVMPVLWQKAPSSLAIDPQEVHVWRGSLEPTLTALTLLERTLSKDERDRAARLRLERDRTRFVASRGILRNILAHYGEIDPGKIHFSYHVNGKPILATEAQLGSIRFNLSHSGTIGIFALTRGQDLGVDIEMNPTDLAVEPLAERFFSDREKATLHALPPELKRQGFLACWTRKEAYLKATAQGLSLALDQFDVSLTPGEPAQLLSIQGNANEADEWTIRDLPVGDGYFAALAIKVRDFRLKYWQWAESFVIG